MIGADWNVSQTQGYHDDVAKLRVSVEASLRSDEFAIIRARLEKQLQECQEHVKKAVRDVDLNISLEKLHDQFYRDLKSTFAEVNTQLKQKVQVCWWFGLNASEDL